LRQKPVLWIWDNVEPIFGFPIGSNSKWSGTEQKELSDFLRGLRDTKAKVLLTSRRDEQGWLGDLPARVTVPPMPMRERCQLAAAIIARNGGKASVLEVLEPLLFYSLGNPLTLTTLVGWAIRNKIETKMAVDTFVSDLRSGEASFQDDASLGRSKSLGASLAYGFEHAFNDDERAKLAILALFQGFVNTSILAGMGADENPNKYPGFNGLDQEYWIKLLSRAAEIGLISSQGNTAFFDTSCGTLVFPWFVQQIFSRPPGRRQFAGAARQAVLRRVCGRLL
jgi:hypothetical protein